MPDITMCSGDNCPRKETCYRHTAKPDPHRQSWFAGTAKMLRDGECRNYWPLTKDAAP